GVSGSGKSSLVFDTLYAEGQRRYVETFSPYARQFLDRMDKPQVDRIAGIPPAIAIDQTNPVRTSRSTVGTMTELNDHLKLLYARAARLYCRGCGREVRRDTSQTIADELLARAAGARVLVTFTVTVPENFSDAEVKGFLAQQGYTRILGQDGPRIEVIQDRLRLAPENRARLVEDLEKSLKHGRGRVTVRVLAERDDVRGGRAAQAGAASLAGASAPRASSAVPAGAEDALAVAEPRPDAATGTAWRFSAGLHCAECDIEYREPIPNFFSFNSPIGACDTCRGFGRVIGVDWSLVVPDESKT